MLAVALVTAPGGAAHAAGKPRRPVALRIGISDGHTGVRAGDRLTYVTEVSNTGNTRTPDLLLTQTLTPGLKLVSSSPRGRFSGGRVMWNKALPMGGKGRFSVTVDVGRPAAHQQRLAAVACASTTTDKRPIVCASHLDLLRTAAPVKSSRRPSTLPIWGASGAGGVVLGGLLWLVLRRRRSTTG